MSKLKHYDIKDIEAIDDERQKDAKAGQLIHCTRVYIKSEVDEAIAELKGNIAQLEDDNALLRKNNAELREATRWINVSEGFPAVGASVLISDGFVRKVGALMYDYTWNVDEVFYDVDDYKFWMPMQKAPKDDK